jgi:hypothetical protein
MSLTNSVFKLLKILYREGTVAKMVYQDSPVLGLFKKVEMGGESFNIPLVYTSVNNRSATFATAWAGTDYARSLQWAITVAENFNIARVDHKTILSANSDKKSFARAIEFQVTGAIETLKRDIAHTLYKDGVGIIGQISTVGATALVFKSRAAVREIEPGTKLISSANADMSSPNANVLTVVSVDRAAGSIVYSGTDTSWAANHYVVISGDANAKFKGFDAWLPSGAGRAAALAASFFGVTRSADATRLGGVEFNAAGKTHEEALIEAEALLREVSECSPDLIIMSPADAAKLKLEITGRFTQGNIPGNGVAISYDAITLHFLNGRARIVEDGACPSGKVYMLKTDTWEIGHLGKGLVNTWEEDGVDALRTYNANSLEIRMYSYMQPYCKAPGMNLVMYNVGS